MGSVVFSKKLKKYLSKRESIFFNCLRNYGFNNQEILGTLSILLSFHQNAVSYIDTGTGIPNTINNLHIVFDIPPTDSRNFTLFRVVRKQSVLGVSAGDEILTYIVQMYGIYRVFGTLYKHMLADLQHTNEQIVDEIFRDIVNTCKIVVDMESVDDNDADFVKHLKEFTKVVLGLDYSVIKKQLLEQVKLVRSNYLATVARLDKTVDQKLVKKFLVMMIYREAIRYFSEVNSDVFSKKFQEEIAPILTPVSGSYETSLSSVVYENENVDVLTRLIIDAYRNLFYELYPECLDVCDENFLISASLSCDINLTIRTFEQMQEKFDYQVMPRYFSNFVNCDISCAILFLLNTDGAKKLYHLHVMSTLYKNMLMARFVSQGMPQNDIVMELYGTRECLAEHFLELLYVSCHAAFSLGLPALSIKESYQECYNALLKIQSAPSSQVNILCCEYDELFFKVKQKLECEKILTYDIGRNVNNLELLLKYLVFNEDIDPCLSNMGLSYQVITCHSNERKVNQIIMTMCRTLGRFDVPLSKCSSILLSFLLKLRCGNVLVKKLIVRLCDIAYFAHQNPHLLPKHITVEDLAKILFKMLFSLSNILDEGVSSGEIPGGINKVFMLNDMHIKSLADLTRQEIDYYNAAFTTVSSLAERLGFNVNDVDLNSEIYCDDFYPVLWHAVHNMQSMCTSASYVGFVGSINIQSFVKSVQLATSYISRFSSELFYQNFYRAELSSLHFLLFNILISNPVMDNIDMVYCRVCSDDTGFPVRKCESVLKECITGGSSTALKVSVHESYNLAREIATILVDSKGHICLSQEIIVYLSSLVLDEDAFKFRGVELDQVGKSTMSLLSIEAIDQLYIPNIYPTAMSLSMYHPKVKKSSDAKVQSDESDRKLSLKTDESFVESKKGSDKVDGIFSGSAVGKMRLDKFAAVQSLEAYDSSVKAKKGGSLIYKLRESKVTSHSDKMTKKCPMFLKKKTCILVPVLTLLFSAVLVSLLYHFQVTGRDIITTCVAIVNIAAIMSLIILNVLHNKSNNPTDDNDKGKCIELDGHPNTNGLTIDETPYNPIMYKSVEMDKYVS
ncbi:hypothetical protein EDL81_03905 [Ehrlichia ruminantium]|nr:hypothetical protein EDL81_03905 [Ehrlichia ruminantium]